MQKVLSSSTVASVRPATSRYISRSAFERTFKGICWANRQGFILNVEQTINWTKMGYQRPAEVDRIFQKYSAAQRHAIRRLGQPYFRCAVFENHAEYGLHTHEAVYIHRNVIDVYSEWLDTHIAGINLASYPDALDTDLRRKPCAVRQWEWFKYYMKGLDPKLVPHETRNIEIPLGATANSLFGVKRENCGLVPFDRVRLSRSMLAKAQADRGFVPAVSLYRLNCPVRYSDREYQEGLNERRWGEIRIGPIDLI